MTTSPYQVWIELLNMINIFFWIFSGDRKAWSNRPVQPWKATSCLLKFFWSDFNVVLSSLTKKDLLTALNSNIGENPLLSLLQDKNLFCYLQLLQPVQPLQAVEAEKEYVFLQMVCFPSRVNTMESMEPGVWNLSPATGQVHTAKLLASTLAGHIGPYFA